MSLPHILRKIPNERKASSDCNLGTGLVYRRLNHVRGVQKDVVVPGQPQKPRVHLRYDKKIFEFCRDGLTQACLKVLFKKHYTTEMYTEIATPPGPDIKTGVYTCVQHVIWITWEASIIEMVCRTYWFPVGLRYQNTVTAAEYNMCINPLLGANETMRRKMISMAKFIAREIITLRTVPGGTPPFLINIEQDPVMCATLIQRQRIQVNPNGRSRFIYEVNDPYSTTIESWPIRLCEDLEVDDEDVVGLAEYEQALW